jgi:hypothetical protein
LESTTSLFPPFNDNLSHVPNDLPLSTERLKKRLLKQGIDDQIVNDCEQIMRLQFSEIQGQVKVLREERSNLGAVLVSIGLVFFFFFKLMMFS